MKSSIWLIPCAWLSLSGWQYETQMCFLSHCKTTFCRDCTRQHNPDHECHSICRHEEEGLCCSNPLHLLLQTANRSNSSLLKQDANPLHAHSPATRITRWQLQYSKCDRCIAILPTWCFPPDLCMLACSIWEAWVWLGRVKSLKSKSVPWKIITTL